MRCQLRGRRDTWGPFWTSEIYLNGSEQKVASKPEFQDPQKWFSVSLLFSKDALNDQKWDKKIFIMLQNIFYFKVPKHN